MQTDMSFLRIMFGVRVTRSYTHGGTCTEIVLLKVRKIEGKNTKFREVQDLSYGPDKKA